MKVTATKTVLEIVESMLTYVPRAASLHADIRYFHAVVPLTLPHCVSRNFEVFTIFKRI